MTPDEVQERMVLLRFELGAGAWQPSVAERDAVVAALSALRSRSVTVAEALVVGTRHAEQTAPWDPAVEDGGSRLTRLMHDVADVLMSPDGGDAERRDMLCHNIKGVLAACLSHRSPGIPSRKRWSRWLPGRRQVRLGAGQ